MTTIFVIGGTLVFVNLLIVAYIAGWELAAMSDKEQPQEPELLRCECRRYAFPSPLCKIHGGAL